jgi:hypothetical protein
VASPPPLAQVVPDALHVRPAQQGWPEPPQAAQVPFAHATPLAVQMSPPPPPPAAQQACPLPPQAPHDPLAQVPPIEQPEPDAVQISFTQQPPLPQAPPPQHASPGPPHATQVPSPAAPPPEQMVPTFVQERPVQQVSPAAPHAMVEVAVVVTVTVLVTVPVFVPVATEVRVAVLVCVVVIVKPLELVEQPVTLAARATRASRQYATSNDVKRIDLVIYNTLLCSARCLLIG